MQTEQLLCWIGMTDTEHNTTSRSNEVVVVIFECPTKKWLFWGAGFYPANHSNLKSFHKVLIG